MIFRHSIRVDAPAARVWQFFREMERNYTRWHPVHHEFQWVDGEPLRVGTTFRFRETIAGETMDKTVRITEVVPERLFVFVPTWWLMRLFLHRLTFAMDPLGDEACQFTAELHLRTGPIGAWLHRRQFDAVRRHMAEEGENLKRLVAAENS
jgi:ligand-binding SRPBCC domain-containing protein